LLAAKWSSETLANLVTTPTDFSLFCLGRQEVGQESAMDRLKLYMRLVVVAALFVLGAVGVYKGRSILKGKTTAQNPSKLKTGKLSSSKAKGGDPEANDANAQKPEDGTGDGSDSPTDAGGDSVYGSEDAASSEESSDEADPNGADSTGTYSSNGSTYGQLTDGDVDNGTSGESDETSKGETADEDDSAYADSGDENATEDSMPEESDVATDEPSDSANVYGNESEKTTKPPTSALSEANSAIDRLRQRLNGKSQARVGDTEESDAEPKTSSPKVPPSNVRIPQEAEESAENEDSSSATDLIGEARGAANNIFGGATKPIRTKPDERYANDPSENVADENATGSATQEQDEQEEPPTVAPEAEDEEETHTPTTPQPERGVAPEPEEQEPEVEEQAPAPEAAPKVRPRNSPAVPAMAIPSTPIPSAVSSSPRSVPRTLPDYGNESSHGDRIRSSSSSGRLAEGPQSPNVVLEKFAPPEVQVGQPATFELLVRNQGDASAHQVTVEEEIPEGTDYHSASPEPTNRVGRKLTWNLGSLPPDEEKGIRLQLTPVSEGEIALSAQVHFQAQADARSVATRPVLEVTVESPSQIHAGDELPLLITISNQGTGAATDVLIEEDVPSGFTHPRGRTLQSRVGTLGPGKSKTVKLMLKAEKAGRHRNMLAVSAAGGIVRREETNIDVIAPSLKLGVSGPKRKYLDAQAIHVLTLENPGTAPAHNVEVVAHLPRGLKFVTATNQGAYDASRHAVYWDLEQLPPGSQGAVRFTTLVEETGAHRIEAEARAAEGVHTQAEYEVKADASSELPFTVSDLSDPIEIGEETVYEVRLANRGARDATGVTVQASFPKEIRPLAVEGDVAGTVSGNKVTFAKIERIGVGQSLVLRVSAKALQQGDFRVSVSVASDDSKTPVVHEEATRVYRDE
jgi:uncharacterized repeat protein (TIGR01451 family)